MTMSKSVVVSITFTLRLLDQLPHINTSNQNRVLSPRFISVRTHGHPNDE
jgi:hypothetical protein